ncbi:hypothetical protein TNCV_1603831 [Trichonephila clavipes]|nr:hypothetical protein TNCV_1603831 [Trichonephila clavipes]
MKKGGELTGANQQLCYAHGIQFGVIDVLYQKNKELKNPNTVDIETSDSDFEDSESDTGNEYNDNYPQTYPDSEEFSAVIEDLFTIDTNVDSEKELSFEQKLELAITKTF